MRPHCPPRSGRRGFTLIELLIGMLISSVVAFSLMSLVLFVSKADKSTFAQQRSLATAKTAIERLNMEIRLATTPLRVVDADGEPAETGHRVLFSREGEPIGARSFALISDDDNLLTPHDNSLVYDPDTSTDGDEQVICRMISPFRDPDGTLRSFRYISATTPLEVTLRTGDPLNPDDPDINDRFTGPGLQGVEIFITVSPRN